VEDLVVINQRIDSEREETDIPETIADGSDRLVNSIPKPGGTHGINYNLNDDHMHLNKETWVLFEVSDDPKAWVGCDAHHPGMRSWRCDGSASWLDKAMERPYTSGKAGDQQPCELCEPHKEHALTYLKPLQFPQFKQILAPYQGNWPVDEIAHQYYKNHKKHLDRKKRSAEKTGKCLYYRWMYDETHDVVEAADKAARQRTARTDVVKPTAAGSSTGPGTREGQRRSARHGAPATATKGPTSETVGVEGGEGEDDEESEEEEDD
jgi:hypothetical protein